MGRAQRIAILSVLIALAATGVATSEDLHQTALAPVFVHPRDPVYDFLDRAATKGLLEGSTLAEKPWTRVSIARALLSIDQADSALRRLTSLDRSRWCFFVTEYQEEIRDLGASSVADGLPEARYRTVSDRMDGWVRPVFRGHNADARIEAAGGYSVRRDSGVVYRRHAEIKGSMRVGAHWAMQATFRDVADWGKFSAPAAPFDPTPAFASVDGDTGRTFYFDDPEALIAYSNNNFAASFGLFPLTIGHGRYANTVLSDKAPAFPHLRLQFQPFSWLALSYVHGTLNSGVYDTVTAWHRAVPSTAAFMNKYYVAHRVSYNGIRGVEIGAGESVVYGGRGIAARYLIPFIPFRAAQHSEGDLDNLQMWGDISVTRLPWTRLYGSLFIDELALNQLFKDDNIHNWWAWQYGLHVTDLWGKLDNVDLFAEYTRANPWVYRHRYDWNTYDTWAVRGNQPVTAYPLGFWQGHNGDYVRAELRWRVTRWLSVETWASQARRGGDGTQFEQYNAPAEPFLFGPRTRTRELHLATSIGWFPNTTLNADVGRVHRKTTDGVFSDTNGWTSIRAALSYGVW